jgi:TPR repeat protein
MRGYSLDPFKAHKWYLAVIQEARGTSYEADQQVMHAWTMLGYLYWRVFPQLKTVGHIDGYSYPAALQQRQQQINQGGKEEGGWRENAKRLSSGESTKEGEIDLSSSFLNVDETQVGTEDEGGRFGSFWGAGGDNVADANAGTAGNPGAGSGTEAAVAGTTGDYNAMEESLLEWDAQALLDKAVTLFEECIAAGTAAEQASEAAAAEVEEGAAKNDAAGAERRKKQIKRTKSFSKIAAGHLGFMYMEGERVETESGVVLGEIPVDREKAIKYLSVSAERGHTWANLHMGMVHEEEATALSAKTPSTWRTPELKLQIAEHMEKALSCFRRAAQGSVLPAYDHMGKLHIEGTLIPRDCNKAIAAWERVAEEQDELQDGVELGRKFFLDGDLVAAITLYSISAESGHVTAQVNAAFLLLESSNKINAAEHSAAAFRYRWMAAEQGDKESQLHLGDYYYHGGFFGGKGMEHLLDPTQVDYATAEHWYTKAASREGRRPVRDSSEGKSYAQALYNLAMMHK